MSNSQEPTDLRSGDADMILATEAGERKIRLDARGAFVVVPRNTWHTARDHAPTTMLFVTPGEGIENSASPGAA